MFSSFVGFVGNTDWPFINFSLGTQNKPNLTFSHVLISKWLSSRKSMNGNNMLISRLKGTYWAFMFHYLDTSEHITLKAYVAELRSEESVSVTQTLL